MKFGNIEDLLRGKEKDVIESVRRIGVSATMEVYGLKYHRTFLAWLRRQTPEGFYPPLIGNMKGGNKAKWLRDNREFVLQCLNTWGKDFVIENLRLEPDTLEHLIKGNGPHFKGRVGNMDIEELNRKLERQDIQIERLREGYFEVKREVNELKSLYGQFVEGVSTRITRALITPVVEQLTAPDKELNVTPDNSLSLGDLVESHK